MPSNSLFQHRNRIGLVLILFGLLMATISGCDAGSSFDCSANTIFVNTFEDVGDGACTPAHCTLREAILAVNACEAPATITIQLDEGTYQLASRGPGDERGDLDIYANLKIIGAGERFTNIQGPASWNDRIFHVAESANVEMIDLTIGPPRNAAVLGIDDYISNAGENPGGGVLNEGFLILENVILQKNRAFSGGGLFNSGNALLVGVTVNDNLAGESSTETSGVRVSTICGGGIANEGEMTIGESRILNNAAPAGAGICNLEGSTLNILNTAISFNAGTAAPAGPARLGGGIYNQGTLSIEGARIDHNEADSGGGVFTTIFSRFEMGASNILENYTGNEGTDGFFEGNGAGVYLSGEFMIEDSTFLDNVAHGKGGGLYIATITDLGQFFRVSISGNNANDGGGLFVDSGRIDMLNASIVVNSARNSGGALQVDGGNLNLRFVTVAYNQSPGIGGMLATDGEVVFESSIISGNNPDCSTAGGSIGSNNYNIQSEYTCPLFESEDLANIPTADVLESSATTIADHRVIALIPEGPAVDFVPEWLCWPNDELFRGRPAGEGCDAGALELGAEPIEEGLPEFDPQPEEPAQPQPGQDGMLMIDTLCYNGPGEDWGVISYLPENQPVEVVGIGEQQGWVILTHPQYNELHCWVPDNTVDLPEPNTVDGLPIFAVPPIPPGTIPDAQDGEDVDAEGPEDCDPDTEYWSIETQSCKPFG
ncbi:MAG: CSLREA domain-containing protein [Chloroflexi bacterium]|nr:MAG: CSLREA domain-containing protein [Chloroflexota bacterium]MBL1197159.1 CSLREA domain-containing protein [Chloroflexota bacterium]NOH14454.1 CSLREA domain-containing protein [Chloroflexota bacterium]